MGQKTHPIGFRLGTTRTWSSRWFATKGYADLLHEDVKIRRYIKDALYHAGISRIDIERSAEPGADHHPHRAARASSSGARAPRSRSSRTSCRCRTGKEVHLNIEEVVHPELDAQLVAENIALQLQKRVAFRRAMKKAVTSALRLGRRRASGSPARAAWAAPRSRAASGIATAGCRCTRSAPTSTTGCAEAHTTFGAIGVKVWIFKGEVLPAPSGRRARARAAMLMPKRVKYRKAQRGRMKGKAQRGVDPRLRRLRAARRSSRAGSPTARSRRRAWR